MWQCSPYILSRYHGRAGGASVLFRIPFWRQILRWWGSVPADRKILEHNLQQGWHTGLAIDGIAGVFHNDPQNPSVFISSRKGVIRLAIRAGIPICPIWFYGACQPISSYGGSCLKAVSRALRISLVIPWGRFGPCPLVPRRSPITGVVGKPIEVEQHDDPPSKYVDEVHQRLCDELVRIFDVHKAAYGDKDKNLKLL